MVQGYQPQSKCKNLPFSESFEGLLVQRISEMWRDGYVHYFLLLYWLPLIDGR